MKNHSKSSNQSFFNVVFVIVITLACCGEFLRIELLLNKQYSRIQELENKLDFTSKTWQKDHKNTDHQDERLKNLDESEKSKNRVKRLQVSSSDCSCHVLEQGFKKLKAQFEQYRFKQNTLEGQVGLIARLTRSTSLKPEGKTSGPVGPPGPKGDPAPALLSPSLTISPLYLNVNENSSAVFSCSAKGNPLPVTSWRKANGTIENGRVKIDSSGSLEITKVTPFDKGKYFCEASSILGKVELSANLEVNVFPSVNLDKGPINRNLGKVGTLPTCHVTGHPKPKITWSKVKGDLPGNRTFIVNGQLSLLNPLKSDSGSYICKSENFLGSVTAVTTVTFLNLPEFTTTPNSIYIVIPGSDIVLPCTAKGSPQPVITWVKDKGNISISRYSISNGKLVIPDANHSDAGTYTCIATGEFTIKATARVQVTRVPKDCSELLEFGVKHSGIYKIRPDSQDPFHVYCDMTTDGGGWTVFQRRQDGSVAFDRNWLEYKAGFGNLEKEFWLGNSYIHRLTARTRSTLRLDFGDYVGWDSHTKFGSFHVGKESDNYKLTIDDISGKVGISFKYNNNTRFSTKDKDNDKSSELNCARSHGNTGWWFGGCGYTNLNGIYLIPEGYNTRGVLWGSFDSYRILRHSEMKIRPTK